MHTGTDSNNDTDYDFQTRPSGLFLTLYRENIRKNIPTNNIKLKTGKTTPQETGGRGGNANRV